MRSDLAKGSLSGVLQVVVTTALMLVAVPLFVRILGQEAFGLYSLVALVGNVNTFANLGLNASLVRSLAEQGKSMESDLDIMMTLVLLLIVILPLTGMGFLLEREVLFGVLNAPPDFAEDAVWLYRSMLVSNVFVLIGGTFTAVLDAQQKVVLTNLFQMVYTVIYWGLILGILIAGLPLKAIAIATLVATVIWFVAAGLGMLRTWGRPGMTGIRAHGMARAKKQLSYGVQLFSAGLINLFYEPLTKLLLAHFLGVREVGIYDIGMRARNIVTSLSAKLLYPLYPLFARLEDPGHLRSYVHDIEQKSMLLVAPALGIAFLATGPLVEVMFGPHNELLALTIVWMVSTYLLWSFTVTPIYVFLMAKDHASLTVLVQIVNVVANGAVFLVTFSWLGYGSVLAGNLASNLLTWVLLLFFQWKFLRTLIFDTWKQPFAVVLVISIGLGLSFVFPHVGGGAGAAFGASLLVLCITVLVYRWFSVLAVRDVTRYLGDGTAITRCCVWLLCRQTGSTVTSGGA